MYPVEKLLINLKLGSKYFPHELHIYSNINYYVEYSVISWKACKSLGILPDCYPHPPINNISVNGSAPLLTEDSIVTEFPMVLNCIIRTVDGEEFHIHLSSNAKPFCVTSPRFIPVISWLLNLNY